MSKKSGKTVQRAEAKTQKTSEAPKDPLLEPIVVPENLRELALGTGIPIDKIVDRANLLQTRVLNIEKAIMVMASGLDEQSEQLKPLVNLAKQIEASRQAMPQQQTPQQGAGGGGFSLGQVLPQILGSSEPDPMTKIFMEAVFRAGLENMFMGGALIKTFVSKTAPELFTKAMEATDATVKRAKEASGT